jgi:hypothetical protein
MAALGRSVSTGQGVNMNMKHATIDIQNQQYIIAYGVGFTRYSFSEVYDISMNLRKFLQQNATTDFLEQIKAPGVATQMMPDVGTLAAFAYYKKLCRVAKKFSIDHQQQVLVRLTPQLIGLERKRVEVVDSTGAVRQFVVGQSRGWMPVHIEVKDHNSMNGPEVHNLPFQSVTIIDG